MAAGARTLSYELAAETRPSVPMSRDAAGRSACATSWGTMASRPDWFLTHNSKHFTPAVARRTGLPIAAPAEFPRALSQSIGER